MAIQLLFHHTLLSIHYVPRNCAKCWRYKPQIRYDSLKAQMLVIRDTHYNAMGRGTEELQI